MIRSFTHVWEDAGSVWKSQKRYTSKVSAVRASFRLPFPTDARQYEDGFWHLITKWTPLEPLKKEEGADDNGNA